VPIIVPPFVAYQAPLIALRGLWNQPPPEGDKFIPCEIDWAVSGGPGQAVQFALSSFSPVEFSQIVALYVDNGRNGSDVDFLFPDTGKQLTVPGYCQGLFPVVTNSLTFYVISTGANAGDVTVFEILNSLPPPVAVLPSQEQAHAAVVGVSLTTASTTVIVPPPTTGTLTLFNLILTSASAANVTANLVLQDGTGAQLWSQAMTIAPNATIPITLSGLRLRFANGLNFIVASPTGAATAAANINVYYSVP
jgi:hypothetical protein